MNRPNYKGRTLDEILDHAERLQGVAEREAHSAQRPDIPSNRTNAAKETSLFVAKVDPIRLPKLRGVRV